MYIDLSNDQSRDDKSLIGIEFDPREYFVAYLTLSPRRLAKWINRQRRLDNVKQRWRMKAQLLRIARDEVDKAILYGIDRPPMFPEALPVSYLVGSIIHETTTGVVLLKKEGNNDTRAEG